MTKQSSKKFKVKVSMQPGQEPGTQVATVKFGQYVFVLGKTEKSLKSIDADELAGFAERSLVLSILEHDLGQFQMSYILLRNLDGSPETKVWDLPGLVAGVDQPSTTGMCLHRGTAEICEQNFRFSVFNEGHLLRNNTGAPLSQIAGVTRCMAVAAIAGATEEANFFGSLLERYLATLYGVVFKQCPDVLDPRGVLAHLQAHGCFGVMANVVMRYQQHYESAWRAGKAPAVPELEDELLDATDVSQVHVLPQ